MELKVKKIITNEIAKRYQKARKKEKNNILNEFCKLTNYNRMYASYILRNWNRKIYLRKNGKLIGYTSSEIKKAKRHK